MRRLFYERVRSESGPWGIALFGNFVFVDTDPQGFQEGEIAVGKWTVQIACVFLRRLGIGLYFIEADRCLKHQEDVEALLPDVFDADGDVLGLGDRLVDRFPKLLNELFDLWIQCHLRAARYTSDLASGIPG